MDPSAVNRNVTIDDFDSLLSYEDQAVWDSPDPSAKGFNAGSSQWWRGTYHQTKEIGASVSLNITGPAVFIYGNTGPLYGSYEVEIDSEVQQYSAYRESSDNSSTLLYSSTSLTYANHNIILRNLGAKPEVGDKGGDAFLIDYIQSTIQLAPAGATVSNVTYEETDPALTYTGTWSNNTGSHFSGGGTAFTNDDLGSVSLSFHGSAVYVLGDKNNRHRIYSIVLDNNPAQFYNATSGCGGAFGKTCEQPLPSLAYLGSNLDDSLHTITITNYAGVNASFFDLDSIVVTVPSKYAPRQLSTSTSPFMITTSGTLFARTTGSPDFRVTTGAASPSFPMMANPLLLLILAVFFLLRPNMGRL
ncbi:hypothetical protein BYT27DRAFT_7086447 [Phlegmacium glaucopus]|nr:hypothetical protein BYT27DRAFT_7086447 [Phlegmacium glaucopus]